MRYLILTLLLISCGKKEPPAPAKANSQGSSSLSLSPTGIDNVQDIFELYSRTGKLTLPQIKNISNKISPAFEKYLDQIKLEDAPDKTYTASELFQFLGESNRTMKWSGQYNLQSTEGWKKLIRNEFKDADPQVLEHFTNRFQHKILDPFLTKKKTQSEFLETLIKLGAVFNVFESMELPDGSLGLLLLKQTYIGIKSADWDLNPHTMSLLKLFLIVDYISPPKSDKPQDSALNSLIYTCVKQNLQSNFPGLNYQTIESMFLVHTGAMIKNISPGNIEKARVFVHSQSYKLIKLDAKKSALDDWSGFTIFELAVGNCSELVPAKTTQSEWMKFILNYKEPLDFTNEKFCQAVEAYFKGISPRTLSPE